MYSDPLFSLPYEPVRPPSTLYRGHLKRILDLIGVALLAPLVVPLVILLALALVAQGQRPFFAHRRVGKDGVTFRCWKLQTMMPGADAYLGRHLKQNPEAAREWLAHRKLTHDPRITRFGRLLRKASLDELPQLYNVLVGDMSFVGPRPITAQELRDYGPDAAQYMSTRPGITGLWQVTGRNQLAMTQRVACDVEYAQTLSLWRDGSILLRTIPAVLSGGQ